MGEIEATDDSGATVSLEPGTLQVLLPGEDVKFSSPADVGGGYEAFQYRTLLSVSASLGRPRLKGDIQAVQGCNWRQSTVIWANRTGGLEGGHGTCGRFRCLVTARLLQVSTALAAENP
jgi:hypothetical protein